MLSCFEPSDHFFRSGSSITYFEPSNLGFSFLLFGSALRRHK